MLSDDVLHEVMTVGEICEQYHVTPTAVRFARDTTRNPLIWRKTGKTILYTRESVERRWGKDAMLPAKKYYRLMSGRGS